MVLTKEEAVRITTERVRILGDLDSLTPGQVLDRYLEAAKYTETQPNANCIDSLGAAAAGLTHAISLIGVSRGERRALLCFTEDAYDYTMSRGGE